MKKGLQLSVNFFVIIILSIVVLSMGSVIFTKLIGRANVFSDEVSEASKSQINKLMDGGEPVAVLQPVRTIKRGETAKFSLGISNEVGFDTDFVLDVTEDPSACSSPPCFDIKHLMDPLNPKTVKAGHRAYTLLTIKPNSGIGKGSYILDATVSYDDGNNFQIYYVPRKIFLNIK